MKATVKSIANTVNQLLDIPSLDPDDARRRKLLNILLAGSTVICGLGIVATITIDTTASLMGSANWEVWANDQQRAITYVVAGGGLVTFAVIYTINRHGPGWLASTLFLLVTTVLLVFSDTPDQVASGSALLGFAIPIMMASVILPPYASFIMAGLSNLLHIPISLSVGWIPNPFAILIFFMIALVSWLAAHSLERALKDLRTLNLELDQHVAQRTGELRAILNSTADGIVVFDTGGKASIANPATEHLLGQLTSG
jgi:PAS domain-containing protein